jgi:hypothetical protein
MIRRLAIFDTASHTAESAETHTASSRKNALQSEAEKAQAVPQRKNISSTNSYPYA